MSEEWHCANCGKPLKEGDEIIDQATGTWTEFGAELGDHFIMHFECPTDNKGTDG